MRDDRKIHRKIDQYVDGLKARATKPELVLKTALDAAKVSYVFQSPTHDGKRLYIADFRIRRPLQKRGVPNRIYVEIDGASHVGRERYDAARTAWIEKNKGAIVIRFTNEQVINDVASVVAMILSHRPSLKTGPKPEPTA